MSAATAWARDVDRTGPGARIEVDLATPGRRQGWVTVDHSDDTYVHGVIPVPAVAVVGEPGPTVLLAAGTHGDEWEGQLLLRELAAALDPAAVTGRVLLLPSLNLPAAQAARRTSPVDGANLNRAFPGDPRGGPTAQLAHLVEHRLLPLADLAVDLHSGGASATYLPSGFLRIDEDPGRTRAKVAVALAAGLPWTFVVPAAAEDRSFSAAGDRVGVTVFATELAGAGGVDLTALDLARAAVARLLRHAGVLTDAGDLPRPAAPGATRWLTVAGWATARRPGLVAPRVRLGDTVEAGQVVADLHDVHDLDVPALPLLAPAAGRVAVQRRSPLVRAGAHVLAVAREIGQDEVAEIGRG